MRDQAFRLRELIEGSPESSPAAIHSSGGQVIAVTSGKGGVGKTTLAVNLALILAERGRTLIVDADLGLANVDVMLGMESGRHIGHLLLSEYRAEDVMADGPRGLQVISGGSGLSELANAGAAGRDKLLGKLRASFTQFDYVLIDTSPGIGEDVVDFLTAAQDVLVVMNTEPTSLRDTYALLKTMERQLPDSEPALIVNSATEKQAERSVRSLNEVARKFLERQYRAWHHVRADSMVGRTIQDRKPLVVSYPRSAAAVSIRRIADKLSGGSSCRCSNDRKREMQAA